MSLNAVTVNIDESIPRDVWTMDNYMTSCGVQRDEGVAIYDSSIENQEEGTDYSLMTQNDIPAQSPVLCVPANMILSSKDVREGELNGIVEPAEEYLDIMGVSKKELPMFHLFLKVLIEYEKGEESPWFPWLDSLPRRFFNGASMTPYCFLCLPPLVGSLASDERVKFTHFYNALKQQRFLTEDTKENKQLARWAYNVVYTRCFGNHNSPGMSDPIKRIVPMADMFNHGTETEIDISFDDDGNCYGYSSRDIPAGSPLRVSYGCPTNPSYLFATYGFLDKSSPATFCKMMDIDSSEELRNIGMDHSRMLFYKDTGDITEEVWDVVLYTILEDEEDERAMQRQFYQACMNGDLDTKNAIHQQYFHMTSRVIQIHVNSFIAELDSLLEQAAAKDINEHPRVPLIMEHNEFVKQTFLNVKANIDSMVAQVA